MISLIEFEDGYMVRLLEGISQVGGGQLAPFRLVH